jgi:hypothetical protein
VLLASSLTLAWASAPAYAIPSDTEVLSDNFESGSLANWTVTRAISGVAEIQPSIGSGGSAGLRLTVPNSNTNSIAYVRHTLPAPAYGVSAVADFNVRGGGCTNDGSYSNGNVTFTRFFDTNGRRVAGLVRINGACNKTAKMYVEHSGQYYRTGKNIALNQFNRIELRISVSQPGRSLVQVYENGTLVYQHTGADNGLLPIASVTTHNEHPNQVGDLAVDNFRIGTFDVPPPVNPCNTSTPDPTTADPGTTILADNFESFGFLKWQTTREGDATASVQTDYFKSGFCGGLLHVTSSTGSRANLVKVLPAGANEVWADGWFDVLKGGTNTSSNVPIFRLFTAENRIVDFYRANGSGQFYLRVPNGSGGFIYTALGRILNLGQWYNVKVHVRAAGVGSTVEVWLNGTRLYSTSTAMLGVVELDELMIGAEHFAQEGDMALDDVVIKSVP